MSKEEVELEFEGVVTECLRGAQFRCDLETPKGKHSVVLSISGKMRKNNIRILLGDRIRAEVSPYDLTKGRIIRRFK